MWRILQNDTADDFVLSTGEMHSVRKFIEKAFELKGIHLESKGEGVNEIGYDTNSGKEYLFIDAKYFRVISIKN